MDGRYTMTQPALLAFPKKLFVPVAYKGKGDPKYSCMLVFDADGPDLANIKTLIAKLMAETWPGRELKTLKHPIKNGTKQADEAKAKGKYDNEFLRGKYTISPSSKMPPQLAYYDDSGRMVVLDNEMDRKMHQQKFFFGSEVKAQINFAPYQEPDQGITAYLNMVVSYNRGTRLAGAASPAEVFGGYIGTESQEDPTAGQQVADEISF